LSSPIYREIYDSQLGGGPQNGNGQVVLEPEPSVGSERRAE
jgi:hypothetical protein